MNILTYRFENEIAIVNIGDVHRGDKTCNVPLFLKAIDYIKRYDSVYWVSTGDILNVALKTSVSDCYESMSLEDEYTALIKELSPIKNKCLGIVASNHHRRLKNLAGFNLDRRICEALQIPYLNTLGVLDVVCGRASYYIALHHGVGSGRKRGSKTNSTETLSQLVPGADIYMEGHTHSFDHFINEETYIDKKRQLLTKLNSYFVVTGHFLQYDGSYAQDYKLPPRPQGASIVTLSRRYNGKDKRVKVEFFQ